MPIRGGEHPCREGRAVNAMLLPRGNSSYEGVVVALSPVEIETTDSDVGWTNECTMTDGTKLRNRDQQ